LPDIFAGSKKEQNIIFTKNGNKSKQWFLIGGARLPKGGVNIFPEVRDLLRALQHATFTTYGKSGGL